MADRQTCNQILLLKLRAFGTLDRRAHHLSHQGGPKSPPHTCIFIALTNLDCFDLGTSLRKIYVLSQGSDVSYIDHWLRAIYLCDRQTYSQTDRQVYFAVDRPHITVCRWTVSILSLNCLKNVLVCFQVSLPINEP